MSIKQINEGIDVSCNFYNECSNLNLDKKEYTLFGIDYNNDKIFKWEDVFNSDNRNTLTEFSSGISHDSKSTMVKRNRNVDRRIKRKN